MSWMQCASIFQAQGSCRLTPVTVHPRQRTTMIHHAPVLRHVFNSPPTFFAFSPLLSLTFAIVLSLSLSLTIGFSFLSTCSSCGRSYFTSSPALFYLLSPLNKPPLHHYTRLYIPFSAMLRSFFVSSPSLTFSLANR